MALLCGMASALLEGIMKFLLRLVLLFTTFGAFAGPTNSILFVTQVPVPADFGTIASTFGNQRGTTESCGRGGDLYIRYPDSSVKNLTRAAGYGQSGIQGTN